MGQSTSKKYKTELDYIYENNIDIHILTSSESESGSLGSSDTSTENDSNEIHSNKNNLNEKYDYSNKDNLNENNLNNSQSTDNQTNKIPTKIKFGCINKKKYLFDMEFILLLYEYVM